MDHIINDIVSYNLINNYYVETIIGLKKQHI